MLLGILRTRRIRTVRKTGDRLFLVVLENLEVVLGKVVYVVPFLVGDYGVDQHQARFFLDGRTDL